MVSFAIGFISGILFSVFGAVVISVLNIEERHKKCHGNYGLEEDVYKGEGDDE